MYSRRGLDPRVVLRQSGVDHALEPRVGHPGIGTQATVSAGPCSLSPRTFGGLSRCLGVPRGWRVDETAVVDLARPRLVVELALQILTSRHEHQGFLKGGIIGGQPGVAQGLDEERRVREVRTAIVAAIAQAAVSGVVCGLSPRLRPTGSP